MDTQNDDLATPLVNLEQAAVLEQLLPIRSLAVTLEFVGEAHPRFFHQAALSALLRHWLPDADSFSRYLLVDAPESGRLQYQAGDQYNFTIVCLAGGESALQRLMQALHALPSSAPQTKRMQEAFGANLCWRHFADNLQESEQAGSITQVEELSCYTMQQLAQETALWAEQHRRFHWQWLSPVRLLKDKQVREGLKGEARYCADAGDLGPALLLARLYDSINALLKERGENCLPPRDAQPVLTLEAQHCFWLDTAYQDEQGKAHSMGGLLGEFTFSSEAPLPPPWAHLLVLGQYLGLGQRRSFGFGRYQLVTMDNLVTSHRQLASRSFFEQALQTDNLLAALEHKQAQQKPRNENEPWRKSGARFKWERDELDLGVSSSVEENSKGASSHDAGELPEPLKRRSRKLTTGEYEPPAFKGVLIRKTDGSWRPLAIAPFYDCVLQRAVAQVLAPALERIMDERSFGYRKGRSRLNAKEKIQLAYREGARYVLEADIDDFFDSVSFDIITQRLRALFHQDPVNDAIMAWLQASVDYQGLVLKRTSGLPQGSPLSPLIANLLLDDFDADMRKSGFQCIRFADDFVVLCKTREQATLARERATDSLQEHGLRLETSKTRVTSFERGFRFLGYLFVNELALDVGSKALKKSSPQEDYNAGKVSGWLADFLKQRPEALGSLGSDDQPRRKGEYGEAPDNAGEQLDQARRSQAIAVGQREELGTFLCISGSPSVISTEHGRLHAEREEETIANIPWRGLRAVLLLGRHHLTTPAMSAAMQFGVPIHFAGGGGRYQGVLSDNQPRRGPRLWLLQQERANDEAACLLVARELIQARIRHQQEVLRQRGLENWQALGAYVSDAQECQALPSLLGIEGQAAKLYYASIAKGLDKKWGFTGRNRRPPRDPLNALLSLGHTLLNAHTETMLVVDGLHPWTGFYHQAHGRHSTLASDMMEPFRHLVERTALSFLSSGDVSPEDFLVTDKSGCRLSRSARRLYLTRLSERFERPLQGRDGERGKLVQLLSQQNHRLITLIRASGVFTAWLQR